MTGRWGAGRPRTEGFCRAKVQREALCGTLFWLLAAGCWLTLLCHCNPPTPSGRCEPLSAGPELADSAGSAGDSSTTGDGSAGGAGPAAGAAGAARDGPSGAGAAGAAAVQTAEVPSDDYVRDVVVRVQEKVQTLLVVEWTQVESADETWLDFEFEEGQRLGSCPKPGEPGSHRDVVLGVPEQTDVTLRIVSRKDGVNYLSSPRRATTGALPSRMPRPEVFAYDRERASPERFVFGAVEDSEGGLDI